MNTVLRNLRFAARLLAARPISSLAVIVSLALGIGASTALFSVVNAIMLRALPVSDPERLVEVYYGNEGRPHGPFSYLDYLDFRRQNEVFSHLAVYRLTRLIYEQGDLSEVISAEMVGADYFPMLDLEMELGRAFLAEETEVPGGPPVVIVSHGMWQRRLGSDPEVIGKSLRLNGRELTVVGVMAEGFNGMVPLMSAQLWVPVGLSDQLNPSRAGELEQRGNRAFQMKGLLEPGISAAAAEEQLNVVARRLEEQYPDSNAERRISLLPSSEVILFPKFDGKIRDSGALLLALAGGLLVLAAANVVNLSLARAAERRREMAIRVAVGGGRNQLVRQLLTESLGLAVLSGALGLLLAHLILKLLVDVELPLLFPFPLAFSVVSVDRQVLLFVTAVSLLIGLVCGLAPIRSSLKRDVASDLKNGIVRPAATHRKLGFRNLLVVSQVAVSFGLTIAGVLFVRSLLNAQAIDPGFATEDVVIASLELDKWGYAEEQGKAFYTGLIGRLEGQPGARSVALADRLPLGKSFNLRSVAIEGEAPPSSGGGIEVDVSIVTEGYFRTLGISLLKGRDFDAMSASASQDAAIVNETLARRFWPGENPVGKRMAVSGADEPLEVVALVADNDYRTLGEDPLPCVYLPLQTFYRPSMFLLVGTAGSSDVVLPAVKREVAALDDDLPIVALETIEDHVAAVLLPTRVAVWLLGAFSAIGLLLAMAGIYGVVTSSMLRRTREIGIRMALGGRRGHVVRLVVAEGMVLVLIGLVLGLVLAHLLLGSLASDLYGLSGIGAVTVLLAALPLAAAALLASLLPARKATKVNPATVLTVE